MVTFFNQGIISIAIIRLLHYDFLLKGGLKTCYYNEERLLFIL